MKVLGIYGSPRKKGNTDILLDHFLEGARSAGAEIQRLYVRDLSAGGCLACGGCDKTGECVVRDDMDHVYPLLLEADVIVVSAPVFFYGVPAQIKALIDRSQALWNRQRLARAPGRKRNYRGGRGYLISVGATRGKQLFDGVILTVQYFFDALDVSYEGGLMFRDIEAKGDISQHPEALEQARELGRDAASEATTRATDHA